MAELRITDIPERNGRHRVEIVWQDRAFRRTAVSSIVYEVANSDAETIRWYLEDYAEFPADPAPAIAAGAEARLEQTGTELFTRVFSNQDALGIWERARERLDEVRVEVDTDPGVPPGLPWELLRYPGTGTPVALSAGEFVRTHLRAAGHPALPEPAGDTLRVLLVISRPGGAYDVPFRSVASRLVRGGTDRMDGLTLHVLRPATFARLSEVLRGAADAGRPYHIVHFDGHGTYLDLTELESSGAIVSPLRYGVSVAGPVRPGRHGYLLFESPDMSESQQLVDGATLGRLLADTGVPVLILNCCRSAYSEATATPGEVPAGSTPGDGDAGLLDDVHARIRAYGSLAAEVADTGVPGVVAMRYNVYVVTAAQFVADLYAHMLAGRSLGRAVTAARRALADNPVRLIGGNAPVALQDWAVPVVYETAPLTLLRPETRDAPLIQLNPTDGHGPGAGGAEGLPRPPDAGFFGRDETLLALDRAFDTQSIVLLHAFAGAGKSATAAEFARWYAATGGLDHPDQPDWGSGAVFWSSFEHHLTADRVIGTAGDFFAPLLEGNGIHWQATTDPAQRRDIIMQVLAQLPTLWVWDNVEPVTGFPSGTRSDWAPAEQDDLVGLLRDLAQRTRCKVLLTSRRDEQAWLASLPARVQLPTMPMRESLQLAHAIAVRHSRTVAEVDWRPLLRYAAGNPLTITILVGQAMREDLTTIEAIEGFVSRLQAGEAQLEAGEDAALGRSRSLAASLSYGFAQAFTDTERARLAVLHLFRDVADVDVLRVMGDSETAAEDAVPELAGLGRDVGIALLDRAADIGLLASLGGGYYQIHPALPWYFTTLFTASYGQADEPAAQRATRAYAKAVGMLGDYYLNRAESGHEAEIIPALRAEEANLRHALDLTTARGQWREALGCMQGLRALYAPTGRGGEWARLVYKLAPNLTATDTDGPLPGLELEWSVLTDYRVRLARDARDWPTAERLQHAIVDFVRSRAAEQPGTTVTQSLSVALESLGHLLREQGRPDALPVYQEAYDLCARTSDRPGEATIAFNLGHLYKDLPEFRDLDQAERWYQKSLSLRPDADLLGRARTIGQLGATAHQRFQDARRQDRPEPELLSLINQALSCYQQALDLLPGDAVIDRAIALCQIGSIYDTAGGAKDSAGYYRRSIEYWEGAAESYQAALVRRNLALALARAGRFDDGRQYAMAALQGFEAAGPSGAEDAEAARGLLADLERQA
jgi:tetratricopeptide (TPR) repeat protein